MQRSQRLIKQWKHKYTDSVSLWAFTCVFSSEGERVFLRTDSSVGGGRLGEMERNRAEVLESTD